MMMSFRQFLVEMPLRVLDFGKENQIDDAEAKNLSKTRHPASKKVSSVNSYHVFADRVNDRFSLVDPKTNNTHMQVEGAFESPKVFHVGSLYGHPKTKAKAHHLYAQMVLKHGIELHGSPEQSVGGMKTWKELSEHPEIDVKHVDDHGNELPMHRGDDFHKNYTDKENYNDPKSLCQTHFVATKKKKLNESPWVNSELDADFKRAPKMEPRPPDLAVSERGKYLPGTMGEHHKIIRFEGNAPRHPGDKLGVSYYLHNIKTGNVEMAVHGEEDGNKYFVNGLGAYAGGEHKAHELYHHLITQHGIHMHSDYEQSTGGMKVWKALHKMPGIHMQSYNGSSETYHELKPSFQRKYDMDSSTRLSAKKKT